MRLALLREDSDQVLHTQRQGQLLQQVILKLEGRLPIVATRGQVLRAATLALADVEHEYKLTQSPRV